MYWIKTKAGEEYPIRFDQKANGAFALRHHLSFTQLVELWSKPFIDWDTNQFYGYLIVCIEKCCKAKKINFPYSDLEDFSDFIEDDQDVLVQCMNYWMESQPKIEEVVDVAKKSAQTVKKGR
jgi:hypothetical protein